MKEKTRSTIWWLFCTLLFVAGEGAIFFFAWRAGIWIAIMPLVGFVVSYIVAPVLHELGHIVFAKMQNMSIVYAKFSFFKWTGKNGKTRLCFASPFAMDETQVIPKTSGNMLYRARRYTIGGLVFGGVYFVTVAIAATLLTLFAKGYVSYAVLGLLPYAGYLFLLNVFPCRYGGGKTDMLVYNGLKRGDDGEKTMLSAMEIQGQLYEGKSYGEIDEKWYFDLPQLPEDEPLFAVMLDLRYRYWLDKGDLEKAADCLNRLANAQTYLSDWEVEKIAGELTYMHILSGDRDRAQACAKLCDGYLQSERISAKRILATVAFFDGRGEETRALKGQAELLMEKSEIAGEVAFEKNLLSRLA